MESWTMKTRRALFLLVLATAAAPAVALAGCGEDSFLGQNAPDGSSPDATGDGNATASPDGASSADGNPATGDAVSEGDAAADVFALEDAADAGDAADGFDGFACDPALSPRDNPCVLSETLGVFVSSLGLDTNPGTRAAPLQTISAGLARAGAIGVGRVYVCQGNYADTVRIASAVSIYGGLACANGATGWSYGDGGPSQVTGTANAIALTVDGVDAAISLEDLRVVAPDAVGQDPTGNGRSSIAVLVNDAVAAIRRCAFVAGAGAAADAGGTGANYVGAVAPMGQPDDAGVGGAGGLIFCTDGTVSAGGAGGISTMSSGGRGSAVPPATVVGSDDGLGGIREVSGCGQGDPGANGDPGGPGSPAATGGQWSDAGWTPSAGGAGGGGRPGQGGGGGGAVTLTAQAGGGGGAGGCGGAGGAGGGGGGASLALVCIASSVSIDGCSLVSSNAGSGGTGGAGQAAQAGALPGAVQAIMACTGGVGGNGGGGGGGAGGSGGVSACILYRGSPPVGTAVCTPGGAGAPGIGGAGGAGGMNANGAALQGIDGSAGLPGVSATELTTP
jgi:hypothetical protein